MCKVNQYTEFLIVHLFIGARIVSPFDWGCAIFQDDGHLSTDNSTVGSDDEWETASGESTDEELPADIMDLAAAAAAAAGETDAGHATGDDGAENVDREAVQEAKNRINDIVSNANPGNFFFNNSFLQKLFAVLNVYVSSLYTIKSRLF